MKAYGNGRLTIYAAAQEGRRGSLSRQVSCIRGGSTCLPRVVKLHDMAVRDLDLEF